MTYAQFMINVAIDCFGAAISVLGLLASIIASRINHLVKRYFIILFICHLVYVLSNLVALIFRGVPGDLSRTILYISNFGEFLFSALMAYWVSSYMVDISVKDENKIAKLKMIFNILMVLHIVALVISQFTGLYYVIDADNIYHRRRLFPLSFVWAGIMLLIDMKVIIDNMGSLSRKQIVGFWAYLIAPFVGIIIQTFVYGIDFLVAMTVLAGIFMFMLVSLDQTERNVAKEMENENIKASLLLGQISPHFIFNSLMTIQDLCYTDPNMAADSIGNFAVYLRHNMEDLTINEMIPFEKELGFIEEYVRLEKMDPDREFDMEYQLEERSFVIPTLTLQPVVENAINYGALTCKEKRGKVILRTRREGDAIIVTVWNNFEGKRSVTAGQKKHRSIATENIKSRLKYFCNGTYEINIGETDAIATIRLPLNKVIGGPVHENTDDR